MTEQTTVGETVEPDTADDYNDPCGENMCHCHCGHGHSCGCDCPRCDDCQQIYENCDCEG